MYVLPAAANAPAVAPHAPLPPASARRTLLPVGLVAAAYTVAQLVLVLPGSGLGWDETVYVSQVGGHAPAAFFSAPRARGISYLVAPLAAVTSSVTALRVFLALLSGAALLGALWQWRPLLPPSVLAWGGALFGSLWITVFYGPQVMPNLWSAFGALAAVGCFLRAVRHHDDRAALYGLGVAVAVVALMRPPDAVWLVLPLFLAGLLMRDRRPPLLYGRRRRTVPAVPAFLAGGALAGAAPWIVESYTDYGGLFTRLHRASEIQGGMGWHVALWDHALALQGRALCRPCHIAWEEPQTALWWFALPVLTALGIAAATRAGRWDTAVLATVTSVSLALPYLFLMGYAAPRFLLPSYALLALPVAECVRRCFRRRRRPVVRTGAGRRVLAGAAVALLAGHLVVQYLVLTTAMTTNRRFTEQLTATAQQLHGRGVRPPCLATGLRAVPVAYYAGCASRQPYGHDESITPQALRALARRMPTAVIVHHREAPPEWARAWPTVRLALHGYRAYVTPREG